MKEKIKNIILTISEYYAVVTVLLMIFKINNIVDTVELTDSKENINKLNEYKEKYALLDKNSCTKLIGDVITHYEDTSYNGKVKLKDMWDYDGNNGLLSYYLKIKETCNFDDKILEEYNLPSKFLTASIQRDELYQRFYFEYELGFVDVYMRDIAAATLSSVEYNINRKNELEIIESLIEIYSKGEIANE